MKKGQTTLLILILSVCLLLGGCSDSLQSSETSLVQSTSTVTASEVPSSDTHSSEAGSAGSSQTTSAPVKPVAPAVTLSNIPPFSGNPYVLINNNVPFFESLELTTTSFETYSNLDLLGRCGAAFACIGKDIMPTEERGAIGSVKPSGWHTVKYDCVDGKYLYNRCHLIGYQLTAENANPKNLITGTRYFNVTGMLPFENMTADFGNQQTCTLPSNPHF